MGPCGLVHQIDSGNGQGKVVQVRWNLVQWREGVLSRASQRLPVIAAESLGISRGIAKYDYPGKGQV